MKRILSIDGGGIRGLFAVQIVARIEKLFRERYGKPDLVLADVFDLFAGTSTGAIIATALCWGMSAKELESFYFDRSALMFQRSPWFRRWKSKYRAENLSAMFREVFSENDRTPAELGTERLQRLLLVVMRNASTGSAWPVTNNPRAKYNAPDLPDNNLRIPIWKLLRASTAAPTYFAPESIAIGDRVDLFVDGGITPYNNPALIAVLMATLPQYQICWPASRHDLHVVSIGTGTFRVSLPKKLATRIHLLDQLWFVPSALLDSIAVHQDILCRILGDCRHGAPIDSEIGDLLGPSLFPRDQQKFTYVRYETRLDLGDRARLLGLVRAALDNVKLIPAIKQLGEAYAVETVQIEHLYPSP